jgi:heat shock protein HtpX
MSSLHYHLDHAVRLVVGAVTVWAYSHVVVIKHLVIAPISGLMLAAIVVYPYDLLVGPVPDVVTVSLWVLGTVFYVRHAVRYVSENLHAAYQSVLEDTHTAERPVERDAEVRLARLATQLGLSAPTLRVLDAAEPVAYSLEIEEPTVVISRAILDTLGGTELDAVLAHELAHLSNRDNVLMSYFVVLSLLILYLGGGDQNDRAGYERSYTGVLKPLGVPLDAVAAFVSRGREYAADRGAAHITGSPAALASALQTLDGSFTGPPRTDARLVALRAVNILPTGGLDEHARVVRTHPPTTARIERLRRLERVQERSGAG